MFDYEKSLYDSISASNGLNDSFKYKHLSMETSRGGIPIIMQYNYARRYMHINKVTLSELSFTATINAPIDGSIMLFTCCLTCDRGSGKYLWMCSYILSNTHTWFSG